MSFEQYCNVMPESQDGFNIQRDSPDIEFFDLNDLQLCLRDQSYNTIDKKPQKDCPQQPAQQIYQGTQENQHVHVHNTNYSLDTHSFSQDDGESCYIKKQKKIKKIQKKTEKKSTSNVKKVKSSGKRAANSNNFGKLLIGTVVDSVKDIRQTIHFNSVRVHYPGRQQYLVKLDNPSISLKWVLEIIHILKKRAEKIPRKNGDRKNLNPIFNSKDDQYKSMEELNHFPLSENELQAHVEFAKHLLREQLIQLFNQQWIEDHSNKKQFKTEVAKKRQNYKKYLKNVKESLKAEKGFSKRLDNKYETYNQNMEE